MTNFMCSTVGLKCEKNGVSKLVRIHFYRMSNGNVQLRVVSGHNLEQIKKFGSVEITKKEFEDRPYDPYNDTKEAIWAMKKCGLTVCLEKDEFEY